MIPEFVLYTRRHCELCLEMRSRLHETAGGRAYFCRVVDIDDDPALRLEFGDRVPVLTAAGRILCEARFQRSPVIGYLEQTGSPS